MLDSLRQAALFAADFSFIYFSLFFLSLNLGRDVPSRYKLFFFFFLCIGIEEGGR